MSDHICQFLRTMGEPEMAGEVSAMAHRLEAFASGLDRDCFNVLREQVEKLKAELESIDGALNDPRANLTLTTSEIIWELKGQVEKLTKERDELHRAFNQPVPKSEWEKMQEQLAALAEQNEKMRNELKEIVDWTRVERAPLRKLELESIARVIAIPDLASPILNRLRAEGMLMAAEICSEKHSLSAAEEAIRVRATKLEKINGEPSHD